MDPKIFAMMHGEKSQTSQKKEEILSKEKEVEKEKDRYEIARDKYIKEQVDVLMQEGNPNNKLLSSELRREKLEQELRNTLDSTEVEGFLLDAVKIVHSQGKQYLDEKSYTALIEELNQVRDRLEVIDLENLDEEKLREAFSISPEGQSSILKIAIAKFNEGLLSEALSIFTFLSNLDFSNYDYAYRLGLIAQQNGRNDLALQAFTEVSQLNPEFIGSHLFAAQCYLDMHERENAIKELSEAKELLKSTEGGEEWRELIVNFEQLLAA